MLPLRCVLKTGKRIRNEESYKRGGQVFLAVLCLGVNVTREGLVFLAVLVLEVTVNVNEREICLCCNL